MLYPENYGEYAKLIDSRSMTIYTENINGSNWDAHFEGITNLMRDAIEKDIVQNGFIQVIFIDGVDVELSVIDYWINLIFWHLNVKIDNKITSDLIFFEEALTRYNLKQYVDNVFILPNRTKYSNLIINNTIDDFMVNFLIIDEFSLYLANTINVEDIIDLAKKNRRFNEILHTDLSGIPINQVAEYNEKQMNEYIKIISEDPDNCLSIFFKSKEGINDKQFKEVAQSIGTKPDGKGNIFPHILNTNYLTGGVSSIINNYIEANTSRFAQMIVKDNTGEAGYFARLLGLNNMDVQLHEDPKYVCNTKHFQEIVVFNIQFLNSIEGRYYRLKKNGMDYKISNVKDCLDLIGQTIFLRSPITCASLSKDNKICYKCYGDLAYVNRNISAGKMAAELISARLTQKMLSAKHLIEAAMKELNWVNKFYNMFEIDCNLIYPKLDGNLAGYKLIISPEEVESGRGEDDDEVYELDYPYFVNEFKIIDDKGEVHVINNAVGSDMYLTYDLWNLLKSKGKFNEEECIIDFKHILEMGSCLFAIKLLNDDLSTSLVKVKSVISSKKYIQHCTKEELHVLFMTTLNEAKIDINSVHAEIIIANQLRSANSDLVFPEWEYENESYVIKSLKQSLTSHPSITISLSYGYITRALQNPMTFKKRKSSTMDLFFMEKPQVFVKEDESIVDNKMQDIFVPIK